MAIANAQRMTQRTLSVKYSAGAKAPNTIFYHSETLAIPLRRLIVYPKLKSFVWVEPSTQLPKEP
jgi:hypothetical protein